MNIFLKTIFLVLFVAIVVSGCDEDVLKAPAKTGKVQFINLDSAVHTMKIFLSGNQVVDSLFLGNSSGYKNIEAGVSREIEVMSGGNRIGQPTRYTFADKGFYTIILYGTAIRLEYLPLEDSLYAAPKPGFAKIRFAHFANSVEEAELLLKPTEEDSLRSPFPFSYYSETNSLYAEVAQGVQTIVIKDLNSEAIAGQVENFDFQTGKFYTIYTYDEIKSAGGGFKIKVLQHR